MNNNVGLSVGATHPRSAMLEVLCSLVAKMLVVELMLNCLKGDASLFL